ncbi:MAG: HAD family hydrolase [Spirochaetales bacterium]|nr:HAD family hydrolase [Spirochaetales bacterium]
MHYRACIFDLDGTLLDTIEDIAAAMNTALAGIGCPGFTTERYKRLVGLGVDMLIKRALPKDRNSDKTAAQVKAAFRQHYLGHLTDTTRPYPGIPELLDELVKRNIKLAILSNKPHEMARLSVQRLLPAWPFQAVRGAEEGRAKKPDPTAALLIADKLGVGPEHVLFIGDSDVDIRTACNAGMKPIAVTWGFRNSEELKKSGADILISKPPELLRYLK